MFGSEQVNNRKLFMALVAVSSASLLIAAFIFIKTWEDSSVGAAFYGCVTAAIACSLAAIAVRRRPTD